MKQIKLSAQLNNKTVEENLRNIGYSSRVITNLRKELGLIKSLDRDIILKTNDILSYNERFLITLKEKNIRPIVDYELPLQFVYEDEDIAVINKPQNLAVISTNNHYSKSLENALHFVWGDFVYRPVNRLDKDTTGLMIIAKNQLAHSILQQEKITKKYLALVSGILSNSGTINAPIYKNETGSMVRVIDPRGKEAITNYKSIKTYSS